MSGRAIVWGANLIALLLLFGKPGVTAAEEPVASRTQQIVLVHQSVTLPDAILPKFPEVVRTVESAGILDGQQTARLVEATRGDLPAGARASELALSSGQARKLDLSANNYVIIQATLSKDQKTAQEVVELHLEMFDTRSGASVGSPRQAIVPLGSSWVVHTYRVAEGGGYGDNALEQFVNRLRNQKKPKLFSEEFLLLTPRVAGPSAAH